MRPGWGSSMWNFGRSEKGARTVSAGAWVGTQQQGGAFDRVERAPFWFGASRVSPLKWGGGTPYSWEAWIWLPRR